MADTKYEPRLKVRYRDELRPELKESLGLSNIMQVPRPSKVVVNMGVGDASRDAKLLDGAVKDLTVISGQKPSMKKARKSLATFKIRQGMPIGAAVTIRGDRMWDFLDRLLAVVLPRIRDFRGLSPRSFDGRGNFNMGVKEQIIFPEVDFDQVDAIRGMDIAITTTAKTNEEAKALLEAFRFPFRN